MDWYSYLAPLLGGAGATGMTPYPGWHQSGDIEDLRTQNHHRPLQTTIQQPVQGPPPVTHWTQMGQALGLTDAGSYLQNAAQARANSPMAKALGINDVQPLQRVGFGTTDDGDVYFNYGRR